MHVPPRAALAPARAPSTGHVLGGRGRPVAALLVLVLLVVALVGAAAPAARAADPEQAVLRGQVTLRDGSPAGQGSVELARMNPYDRDGATATLDADGRWEASVRPGIWAVTAETAGGLRGHWPDLPGAWPEEQRPTVTVSAGEVREGLNVRLRQRMPTAAVDEYDVWHRGTSDPQEPYPTATVGLPRYPYDPVRPVSSVVGAKIEELPGQGPRDAQGQPFAITGIRGYHTVEILNRGDDAAFIRDVRVEGPDADLISCVNPGLTEDTPCRPQPLFPGWAYRASISTGTLPYRPVYRVEVVFELANPDRTLRYPLQIRNLLPPGVQITDVPDWLGWLLPHLTNDQSSALLAGDRAAKTLAPAARAAAQGARLDRRRVRVAFPAAGTARVGVQRRVGGQRARWKTVRTVRLRATRAGTVSRRVQALAPGRYRLRVRVALQGTPPKTATVTRTVARAPFRAGTDQAGWEGALSILGGLASKPYVDKVVGNR